MTGKIVRLVVPLALLALPSALSSAGPLQCYRACYDDLYPSYCSGLPPGPEHDQCAAYIVEVCRCQCYPPEYCP